MKTHKVGGVGVSSLATMLPESVATMIKAAMFSHVSVHNSTGDVVEQVDVNEPHAVEKTLTAMANLRDPRTVEKRVLIQNIDDSLRMAQQAGFD